LTPGLPWVYCACFRRLKLKCVEATPNFAFNFNLRRYTRAEQSPRAAHGRPLQVEPMTPALEKP
jgi:hypothetical protein